MARSIASFKVQRASGATGRQPTLLAHRLFGEDEDGAADRQKEDREYTSSFTSTRDECPAEKVHRVVIPAIPNSSSVIRRPEGEKLGPLDDLGSETDIDYGSVSVEDFGQAVLLGLGWTEQTGIGKSNRQVVPVAESAPRPKGLGLGALPKNKQPNSDPDQSKRPEQKEDLKLKVGAYVKRKVDALNYEYGKVVSLDEDNVRLLCLMALSKETLSLSQYSVDVVSSDEYRKNALYINREKYEKYKKWESEQKEHLESVEIHPEPVKLPKSKVKMDKPPSGWIYPMIRVRFIDKGYQGGRYYKKKAVVDDVISLDCCTIVLEDGRILDDVKESQLETVVPKEVDAPIMILIGKFRGHVGRLLQLNPSKCRAVVSVSEETLSLNYDDFAEYVGGTD